MAPLRQPIAQLRTLTPSGVPKIRQSAPPSPHQRRRLRRVRLTPLVEVGARVGMNGLLTILGMGSLAHLLPHVYHQVQSLASMQVAIETAETAHLKLQADFNRYFDPTQFQQLIQEQSGYQGADQRPVVWIDATAH